MARPARAEINASRGGGGHADHEIARGGGNFRRHTHENFVRQDFHDAGADSEQARDDPCAEHQSDRRRNAGNLIGNLTVQSLVVIRAVEAEEFCPPVVPDTLRKFFADMSENGNEGEEQCQTEKDRQELGIGPPGKNRRASNAPDAVESSRNMAMRTLVMRSLR